MPARSALIPGFSALLLLSLTACGQGSAEAEAVAESPASSTSTQAAPSAAESSEPPSTDGSSEMLAPAEGIIAVAPITGGGISVMALRPGTGQAETVAGGGIGSASSMAVNDWPAKMRKEYAPDFSRMVGEQSTVLGDPVDGLGWYEANGEFVNVTETLDESTGDFGNEIHYGGAWFDEEGNFHFGSYEESSNGKRQDFNKWYMVPAGQGPESLKDMGTPPERPEGCWVNTDGSLTADDSWCTHLSAGIDTHAPGQVADWISDNEYITSDEESGIFREIVMPRNSFSTEQPWRITPDVNRIVYSAVLSPDKTQIAFLSPKEDPKLVPGPIEVELFTVPADGSAEPELIDTYDQTEATEMRLIDWL